jgi:predicted GNAT family acetyltransferase
LAVIRPAAPEDMAPLRAFLAARIETSMFLLGNLEAHGLCGADHAHATRYWLADGDSGVAAVLGLTHDGVLLPQAPGIDGPLAQALLAAVAGRRIKGITGAAGQVQVLRDALALPATAWQLDDDQPLFRLDLADLAAPRVVLRKATEEDRAFLTDWFAAYMAQTQTAPPGDLAEAARLRAEAAITGTKVRLLIEDGRAVAMAAINARAGRAVQIGGVFVPPALRGAGRGGVMVAGLLAEERGRGAQVAILFAASDAAARAYARIGFQPVGRYHLALLKTPHDLGGAP